MTMPKHAENNAPKMRERETLTDRISHITRRQFIIGAAATGAVIAASGGIYYAVEGNNTEEGLSKLTVSSSQIISIEDCEKEDSFDSYVYLEREVDLSYNTIVNVSCDAFAAILEPTDVGNPLVTASLISLSNSDKTYILHGAITQERSFEIFDFRANEKGFVWIESNVLTGKIYVYTSPFKTDMSTSAKVALELDSKWNLPDIEIYDNSAWIQASPKDSTSAEKSKLFKIALGDDQSSLEQVCETKTFATAPTHTKQGIVITPRNEISSARYDICLLDGQNAQLLDVCTLPQSMTPQDATYGKTGFSFSFQGSYDYGDGISNVGTYAQTDIGEPLSGDSIVARDERIQSESQSNWLHFSRSPYCAPAWLNNMIAFKSTKSIAIFKPEDKKYALISADDGADDYGVWLCSAGESEKLVTITNIDYTPLSGEAIKSCKLKVYSSRQ